MHTVNQLNTPKRKGALRYSTPDVLIYVKTDRKSIPNAHHEPIELLKMKEGLKIHHTDVERMSKQKEKKIALTLRELLRSGKMGSQTCQEDLREGRFSCQVLQSQKPLDHIPNRMTQVWRNKLPQQPYMQMWIMIENAQKPPNHIPIRMSPCFKQTH